MASTAKVFLGSVTANEFVGSGLNVNNIQRANIVSGTPNQIVVNDPSGDLTSIAQISPAQGGTGIDTSASSGVVQVTAGVWSVAPISFSNVGGAPANRAVITNPSGDLSTEAQLAPSRGGTGLNTSASSGIARVSGGTWSVSPIVNTDIAPAAAITRSKLAAGTPNTVVINDGGGNLSSQSELSTALGGTGQDFSGVGVGPFLITNSSGVFSSTLQYSVTSSPNSIVQRDPTGNISLTSIDVNSVTTNTLTSTGPLAITPVGDININNSAIIRTAAPGSVYLSDMGVVTTINATTDTAYTLVTSSGTNGTAYTIIGNLAGGSAVSETIMINFQCRAKNNIGVITIDTPIVTSTSSDAALSTATIGLVSSGANILIQVSGVAGRTIDWMGKFEVISQEY